MFIQNNIFKSAVQIIRKRFYFMELLQKWAEPIHIGISRGLETLKVSYGTLKGIESGQTKEEMESILNKRLLEMQTARI